MDYRDRCVTDPEGSRLLPYGCEVGVGTSLYEVIWPLNGFEVNIMEKFGVGASWETDKLQQTVDCSLPETIRYPKCGEKKWCYVSYDYEQMFFRKLIMVATWNGGGSFDPVNGVWIPDYDYNYYECDEPCVGDSVTLKTGITCVVKDNDYPEYVPPLLPNSPCPE